jgi:hypothetical protein
MPFDPTLPANGSQILSAELRSQFTSLKALIDAHSATITSQAATIAALQTQLTNLENSTTAQFSQVNADISDRVTTGTFDDGMSDTAKNVNSVAIIGTTIADPPSQLEVQAISDKVDELISGLHR